jgi:uncharacterized protein YecT (DUF1311 family)
MMNEEDEAFNEIERRSKVKQTLVKAQLDKPQRTWVGLTDREMKDAIQMDDSPVEMGRKIEAKLKEKNT